MKLCHYGVLDPTGINFSKYSTNMISPFYDLAIIYTHRNTFLYILNEYDLAVLRFSHNLYVIFVELNTIRYHWLEIHHIIVWYSVQE